jgi:predicted house-cleaning noncanonical NTP pyrophosphatase (MazG superfamily)
VVVLTDAAYRSALLEKLREEADELAAAQTTESVLEEAADVLEVLSTIAEVHGATIATIVELARKKRAQRGGFAERLWLEGVDARPLEG